MNSAWRLVAAARSESLTSARGVEKTLGMLILCKSDGVVSQHLLFAITVMASPYE